MTLRENMMLARLAELLPGATVVKVDGDRLTIDSQASGPELLEAEIALRRWTGVMWEILLEARKDDAKLPRGGAPLLFKSMKR